MNLLLWLLLRCVPLQFDFCPLSAGIQSKPRCARLPRPVWSLYSASSTSSVSPPPATHRSQLLDYALSGRALVVAIRSPFFHSQLAIPLLHPPPAWVSRTTTPTDRRAEPEIETNSSLCLMICRQVATPPNLRFVRTRSRSCSVTARVHYLQAHALHSFFSTCRMTNSPVRRVIKRVRMALPNHPMPVAIRTRHTSRRSVVSDIAISTVISLSSAENSHRRMQN